MKKISSSVVNVWSFIKRHKSLFIVLLVIIMVPLSYFGLRCYFSLHDSESEYDYCEQRIGRNGLIYNDCHGYIKASKTGKKLITGIDWIRLDGDSICVIAIDDKRAYINLNTCKLITDLAYDKAWVFCNGVGVMTRGDSLYVFDRSGKRVNRKPFYYDDEYEMVFHDGVLVVHDDADHIGVIDTKCQWIFPPIYDELEYDVDHKLCSVRKGDKRMVFNNDMDTILCGEWKNVSISYSAGIVVTETNGVERLFDYDGKLLCDVVYSDIETLSYNTGRTDSDDDYIYEECNCLVYSNYSGKKGLMDRDYKILTPPIYSDITAKSRHILFATFSDNWYNEVGTLIDDHGHQIR